jgi:pimeloyl-ACP methyl ester carboxylesterase
VDFPSGHATAVIGEHELHVETHAPEAPSHEETLLFVHGAGCGSWFWENVLPYFSERGWRCAALNWRGHHHSRVLEPEQLAALTLYDYVDDIDAVASEIDGPFITVAHSIGGLVALKHAEIGFVQSIGLALYAPAPPAQAGGYNFPSYGERMPAPPFDLKTSRFYFFYDIDDEALRRYTHLLGPESTRVLNASGRNEVDVDPARVSGPILVVSAEFDAIQGTNSGIDREIARVYGADYVLLRGHGHLMLVENDWQTGAQALERWLRRTYPIVQ